jgi:HD domain-containing protein
MLLAGARRADNFHAQAPLGRAFGCSTEGENLKERAMIQAIPRKLMNRRAFLKASSTAAGAIAVNSQLSERAAGQSVDESPTFRRPKTILPVPTPSPQFQHVEAGVPDTQLTREATGLLREFSTPVLINHSHRVFFWANEMGRQTGQRFDVELVFICAAFHDLGLLKKFSSDTDRFEVDSANVVRQFLEHHGVLNVRIQTAWDAISLHTTPGIAAYKPLEVELLYNGVALDSLGVGYETFPAEVRTQVVGRFPRVNFKQEIAEAFFHGFEHKPQTTEYTCNEDICSHFIRNYKRRNFYDQVQNSPFQNS